MKQTLTGTIYMVVNSINGQKYIGQTVKKPKYRLSSHFSDAFAGSRLKFHAAIRQFGKHNFELVILQSEVPLETICYIEAYYIAKYDTVYSGYNTDPSGGRKGEVTEETRKKLRECNKGRVHTDSARKNMSEAQRNRKWKMSDEGKKAISNAHKGIYLSYETREKMSQSRIGLKHSEETRKKISEGQRGKKRGPMSQEHKNAILAGMAKKKISIEGLQINKSQN